MGVLVWGEAGGKPADVTGLVGKVQSRVIISVT